MHPHARSLLDPGPDVNVEKILTRSVVLQDYERLNLLVQLERGVSLFRDWSQERSNVWNKPSRVSRKKWWWGSGEHQLEWQERLWEPRPTATKEDVFKELSRHSSGQSQTAEHVIAQWKSIWEKWWIEQPHQKTTDRIKLLNWWTSNYSQFERGKGIEATDPQVFGRTRGIVLGWEGLHHQTVQCGHRLKLKSMCGYHRWINLWLYLFQRGCLLHSEILNQHQLCHHHLGLLACQLQHVQWYWWVHLGAFLLGVLVLLLWAS